MKTNQPSRQLMRMFPRTVAKIVLFCLIALSATSGGQLLAQKPKSALDDFESDILADLQKDSSGKDLEGLRYSHLSLISSWEHVEPLDVRRKVGGAPYAWKSVRANVAASYVSPVNGSPIATQIEVPRDGEYRFYLRHWLGEKHQNPILAKIEPLTSGGGLPSVSHTFGKIRLLANVVGKEAEKKLPLRFESQVQLNTPPDATMFAWEYVDLKLKAGAYRLSIQSDAKDARAHSIFLTQSKTFRPSFSEVKQDNTLDGIYVRYRVLDGAASPQYSFSLGVTYHWRGRLAPNSTEPLWYDTVGAMKQLPAKDWTPFIDAREQILPGGGPWSTFRTSFQGVTNGRVEVQFAWHPHEAAIVRSFETAVSEKQAMFRMPHGRYAHQAPASKPQWGVWSDEAASGIVPEEAVVEKYFVWAQEAAKKLGVKDDHPKPKQLRVLSGCRTGVVHRARAAEMLAKLGVNWIPDAPPAVAQRFNLYDDRDHKKVKLGDEISTYTSASVINDDVSLTVRFHDYLREQASLAGADVQTFFGVDDVRQLQCIDRLPMNAGRFERRLFYCSQRFCHLATVGVYSRLLRDVERKNPTAIVYNNYSPHPVFLTGRDMNGADWFLLPRAGAQTLGWAEDWATGGSWGLGTPMAECTTFYAALVDCAVRTRGYPSGFYVGSNCGYSAQKLFSCVSQGISILHLYDWGPIDGWAEGSNSWSEMEGQYLSVMQGTHALGPADEIVARGKREPRRTAILYNRSHEIVSGGQVWLNRDWMWTFLGLRNSQIPVDVVIEEDLTESNLQQYEVLYVGGLNLERRHAQVLRKWVEQGGVLIGSAGFAQRDIYGDRLKETVELFGAEQRLPDLDDSTVRSRVKFNGEGDFPAVELSANSAGNQKYVLSPTTSRAIATYESGEVAAVLNTLGKGKAILLGVTAGEMYRGAGGAKSDARAWLIGPAQKKLGRSTTEYDCPESEVTRFDHPSGIAVLVAIYTTKPDELPTSPGKLSVQTDRPIKEVVSGLRGPVKWQRVNDRIEIETPPAAELGVDTFILK